MIAYIDIEVNAANPQMPLGPFVSFVGSPANVRVKNVPGSVGSWDITAVSIAYTTPDNAITTVGAVNVDGCWVATLPASTVAGRCGKGLQVIASGTDENGVAVTGYVLGAGDVEILPRDGTAVSAGVQWYFHYLDAMPATPCTGDVCAVNGVLQYYDGTTWRTFPDAGIEVVAPSTDPADAGNAADAYETGTALAGKADKVANATAGNLAALDANGDLADSGKKAADFAADNAVVKLTGGTMSGNLKFVGEGGQLIGVEVEYHGAEDVSTVYAGNSIIHTDDDESEYLYLFPNETGTLALTSDIPTASTSTPQMDGTASAGSSTSWAKGDHVHPTDTSRVAANAAITGATKCKITYDSKGLVTAGADLEATDIPTLTTAKLSDFDAAIRYAMPAAVALVAENDAATLVCADRAVTNATIASGFATLNLTFPAEASGYVRDFYLRITVAAGESAPAISVPQGVTIENAGGAVPVIADGEASAAATTLVWFSETAPGIFTAKSETVKAVA